MERVGLSLTLNCYILLCVVVEFYSVPRVKIRFRDGTLDNY